MTSAIGNLILCSHGHEYDHHQPARHLLEHPELVDQAGSDTLDKFEKVFETVNQRLS